MTICSCASSFAVTPTNLPSPKQAHYACTHMVAPNKVVVQVQDGEAGIHKVHEHARGAPHVPPPVGGAPEAVHVYTRV